MKKLSSLTLVGVLLACGVIAVSVDEASANQASQDPIPSQPRVPSHPKPQPTNTPSQQIPSHPKPQLAPSIFPKADQIKFKQIMQDATETQLYQRPMPEIIQTIAEQLLKGSSYQAGLLEQSPQEQLVLSLNNFDCVLFVETALAIARGVAVQDYSMPTFIKNVREQRYRYGEMDGYCSRLHYFSEWIENNGKRHLVSDLTPSLKGIPLNKEINFMSKHRKSYPRLKDQANYQCIINMESRLKGMDVRYIPTSQIRQNYKFLQPGDIVAVAIDIPGLDVSHTGLVYRSPKGQIGLIHAPAEAKRVMISPDLQTYMNNLSKDGAIGLLVARPIDPRQLTLRTRPTRKFENQK